MLRRAPLADLRVLELAHGIAGPYGGRLLAMLGASVVKVEPEGGDPARGLPVDDAPLVGTSPVYLHLSAGKRNVLPGTFNLEDALDWAHVVIDGRVRAQLAGGALDPAHLRRRPAAPDLISATAWGFEARDAGAIEDELLVQAVAGVMSVTGDADGPPLRFPGWQTQYLTGAYVAAAALTAIRSEGFRHVDLAWAACAATGVEASWSRHLQTGETERPGGAHPAHLYPSGALPCADGHVVPGTIRLHDWTTQCEIYGRADLVEDPRFRRRTGRATHVKELWDEIRPWYAAHSRQQIFDRAIECQWALGMILTGSDTLADRHLAERGFLGKLGHGEGDFIGPVAPWKAPGLPVAGQGVSETGADAAPFCEGGDSETPRRSPLADLKVLELTVAWAGPFVGRYLGALGADVVKVEAVDKPDGWRGPHRFGQTLPGGTPGHDPDDLSLDIAPNFNSLNRNKRALVLDLKDPRGRALCLELVAEADVVVANFTSRVLPGLGLDYPELRRANPRVVLLNMPALGASGPYSGAAGYGSIIEGMGGFAARFGRGDEGARVSQTFYPDPVAGIHGTVAVLAALAARDRVDEGAEIDLSQQEALWLQLGEAIVAASRSGKDLGRLGNREPGVATSGVFRTSDGAWVAVVSRDDCGELVASSARLDRDDFVGRVRTAGGRAEPVLGLAASRADRRMRPWLEELPHPVAGRHTYLRVPLRIDGAHAASIRPSPLFDQHTDEVLSDWIARSPDETAELRGHRVVGAPRRESTT